MPSTPSTLAVERPPSRSSSYKEEREIASGLVRIWSRLGIPGRVKFDNGQSFQGGSGHLSLAVRLAVSSASARADFPLRPLPMNAPARSLSLPATPAP